MFKGIPEVGKHGSRLRDAESLSRQDGQTAASRQLRGALSVFGPTTYSRFKKGRMQSRERQPHRRAQHSKQHIGAVALSDDAFNKRTHVAVKSRARTTTLLGAPTLPCVVFLRVSVTTQQQKSLLRLSLKRLGVTQKSAEGSTSSDLQFPWSLPWLRLACESPSPFRNSRLLSSDNLDTPHNGFQRVSSPADPETSGRALPWQTDL